MTNGIPRDLSDLLSFAQSLNGYVKNASPWSLKRLTTTGDNLTKRVPLTLSFTAYVALPHISLPFTFLLPPAPLRYPPLVRSSAPWLRRINDWHVHGDGSLCWTFPQHYCEMMRELAHHLNEASLLQTAAYWCVSKSAELVQRHFEAEQCALKTWPAEWDAWPHGVADARARFDRMKRSGEFEAEIRQLLAARKM